MKGNSGRPVRFQAPFLARPLVLYQLGIFRWKVRTKQGLWFSRAVRFLGNGLPLTRHILKVELFGMPGMAPAINWFYPRSRFVFPLEGFP